MQTDIKEVIFVTDTQINNTNTDLINGYLAHKWGLQSSLPSEHPYRNVPPTWDPSQITTDLWLDSEDTSTFSFELSDPVEYIDQWSDQSGNNRHATQAIESARPTYEDSTISFDGINDFFDVDLDFLINNSHQSYVVIERKNGHSNIYGARIGNMASGSIHVGFDSSTRFRINYWGHDFEPIFTTGYDDTTINILSYQWIPGTRRAVFSNGYLQGQTEVAGTVTDVSGGGRLIDVTGQFVMAANIKEIIFITDSEITPENDQKIVGYLALKWNLQDSLPNDHPYKSEAPLLEED